MLISSVSENTCKEAVQRLDIEEGEKCSYGQYNGTCVKYYRCLSVLESVKENNLPPLCSFVGMDPVLCCPDCELTYDARKAVNTTYAGLLPKKGLKAFDKCIDYLATLPYDCRNHNTVKYSFQWSKKMRCTLHHMSAVAPVGGEDAKRSEFPHMALLGYGENLESAQWLCAGSLISDRYVLTAAHCLGNSKSGPVRYIGLGILKRSDPKDTWQIYEVKTAISHPEYRPPKKYNDIALLETDKPVNFSWLVLPACLHTPNEFLYEPQVHAAGWGYLGHGKPLADTLQSVRLQKFSTNECSSIYRPHRHLQRGFDENTQMCYGHHTEAKDTCSGDSGGPLAVFKNLACQYSVFGITSAGIECGQPGNAGLYTRIDPYLPWIESVVWP